MGKLRRSRAARLAAATTIAAMLVLAGCTSGNEEPPADNYAVPEQGNGAAAPSETGEPEAAESPEPTEPTEPSEPSESERMTPDELSAAFDEAAASAGSAREMLAFVESYLADASPEGSDAAARRMLAYYETDLPRVQQSFEQEAVQSALLAADKLPATAEEAAAIPGASVRDVVANALDGGYKLTAAEGFVFPEVDYAGLSNLFDGRLTDAMRDYLDLLALESERSAVSDGGLVITWDELGARALQAERFVREYPDAPEYEAAFGLFERYMTIYVSGLDNTPVYDFETNLVLDEAKASYARMAADNPGTAAAAIASEYLALLEAQGGQVMTGNGIDAEPAFEVALFWDGMPSRVLELLGQE